MTISSIATARSFTASEAPPQRSQGRPITAQGRVPKRHGFGTRLIAGGIQHELSGELRMNFELGGLRCHRSLPLANGDPGMLSPSATGQPH